MEGFPPIFRLSDDKTLMLITESVKNELDVAGSQGIIYEEL